MKALWLAVDLPRLALFAVQDAVPSATTDAVIAVTAARGSRRWLVAASDPGLPPGIDIGLARSRRPSLRVVERLPERERQALETLASAAYALGDRVGFRIEETARDFGCPRFALWLEIGSSQRLFGGLRGTLLRFEQECAALGHAYGLGVAPTLEAATVLARAGGGIVERLEDVPASIGGLPLSLLSLPATALDLLADVGVQRIDDLLQLPRDRLGPRCGAASLAYLDRLTGLQPDPRKTFRPPSRFFRQLDFLEEIQDAAILAFPARRLIAELIRYLRARDTGVQRLRVEIAHPREIPATGFDLTLTTPGRDEALLLRLLRERLAALVLPAPARALSFAVDRCAQPPRSQHDLFDRRPRLDEEMAAVTDRLRARLGDAAIWQPAVIDDHRPECAASRLGDAAAVSAPTSFAPRPTLLLRTPRRLERPPPIMGNVERIESGWWEGGDVRRDYFVCELERGVRGWAYYDPLDGQIYLHGVWA